MIFGTILEVFKDLFFKITLVLLSGEMRNKFLRSYGIKIGKGCEIHATGFSTEPFLIEIGDHVSIASGTVFLTHDGSVRIIRDKYPEIDLFGKILIGNNTFIGTNCLILPNTSIGSNCIIGAGSVIRGCIPDDSVAFGNPAKVIMNSNIIKSIFLHHKNCLKTKYLSKKEKMKIIKEHFNLSNSGT
jgi:acetyltransferase-like isoleucine patch superfamily enzyme